MFPTLSYLSETGVPARLRTILNLKALNPPEIAFNTTTKLAPYADIQILTLLNLVVNIPSKKELQTFWIKINPAENSFH